jgi:hypothetical protein
MGDFVIDARVQELLVRRRILTARSRELQPLVTRLEAELASVGFSLIAIEQSLHELDSWVERR